MSAVGDQPGTGLGLVEGTMHPLAQLWPSVDPLDAQVEERLVFEGGHTGGALGVGQPSASTRVPGSAGAWVFFTRMGMPVPKSGMSVRGAEHGPENRQLERFAVAHMAQGGGVGHPLGIGGHHPRYIGPDLDLAGPQSAAEKRRGVIAAATPQRRRAPICGGADEARDHEDPLTPSASDLSQRARSGLGVDLRLVRNARRCGARCGHRRRPRGIPGLRGRRP